MAPTRQLILGIETTCDETAAAVFDDQANVLASVVASQTDLHAQFGGVVPEVAARAHLRQLLPIIESTVQQAGVTLADLNAVAVAHRPGLIGAILVGLTAAKSLCVALDIPLLGVNHIEGHIYACQMAAGRNIFPCIGYVVSGGHTNLFVCRSAEDLELVGSTIDDAAGEAFDKVAAMLHLGYPGGPVIEKTARQGNPKAFDFPRTFINEDHLDCSFSGLKTAVRYAIYGQNTRSFERELEPQTVADAAASFQQAVIDVLVAKAKRAVERFGINRFCLGGGVACNGALRSALQAWAEPAGVDLILPPPRWCTDNAAMAAISVERFRRGQFDSLDLDAVPGLVRKPKS